MIFIIQKFYAFMIFSISNLHFLLLRLFFLAGNNSDDVIYASLVVFVIDVRNKESLSSAKESLKYVPVDFFMGRILFLGRYLMY